jgi:predicted nucleic acid-binding protein
MTFLCADASFVIRLITLPPENSSYFALWEQWVTTGTEIVAPSLLLYEVSNGLYRQAAAGLFTFKEAAQFLQAASILPIALHQDNVLHQRSCSLAQQLNLPATYDAHYLALSERLSAEFWTCDRRLFNAVQSQLHWVHLMT